LLSEPGPAPPARQGAAVPPPGHSATAILTGDSSVEVDSVVNVEKTVPLPEPPPTLAGTLVPDVNLWQQSRAPSLAPQPHEETLTRPDEGSVTDSLTAPETAAGRHPTQPRHAGHPQPHPGRTLASVWRATRC